MVDVYLCNKTDKPIYVTGCAGTDWGDSVKKTEVGPGGVVLAGRMTDPTSSTSDHWGWIFVGLKGPDGDPSLQLYVSAGTSRGLYDYAVQCYDGGENRSGTSMAEAIKSQDGSVAFFIHPVFDWMNRLPADKMLHQITIPGTHDSGSLGLLSGSETQSASLEDQLLMGARYFDIRVDAGTHDLRIVHGGVHGSGNTDVYFKDAARTFRKFLTGSRHLPTSKETVLLQVKADRGSEAGLHTKVVGILKREFSLHPNKLYLTPILSDSRLPTLDDLRGKLVLLRRYDCADEDGDEAGTPVKYFVGGGEYNGWSGNPGNDTWPQKFAQLKPFEWPDADDNKAYFNGVLTDYRNRHGLSFVIQDRYKNYAVHEAGIYQDKFELVKSYLDAASQGQSPDSWFLNFASCTPPEFSHAAINPLLKQYFAAGHRPVEGCGFGTILMDFVEPALVRTIVDANFRGD